MARKSVRAGAGKDSGEIVKISVSLDGDTWRRLKMVTIMRRTTATDFVAALVEQAVSKVRLPTVGDADQGENAA